jgi:hypothetical protein
VFPALATTLSGRGIPWCVAGDATGLPGSIQGADLNIPQEQIPQLLLENSARRPARASWRPSITNQLLGASCSNGGTPPAGCGLFGWTCVEIISALARAW